MKKNGGNEERNERLPHFDRAQLWDDQWTAVTRDRSLSAQFEHSIGITDEGAEIFTLSKRKYDFPPYDL